VTIRRSFLITATLFLLLPDSQNAIARNLTLEDRIDAQEAIERVYWKHRIWPSENGTPKPLLEKVLTRSQIHARVVDYIRKSNALAAIWNRPIMADHLQYEMRRMAAESQAPDVLRELFAALGDDPFTIAETLARQTLADRLIREAYANDNKSGDEIRRGPQGAPEAGRGRARAGDADSQRMSFDAWWASAGASVGAELVPVSESIEAVEISFDPACVEDSWRAIPAGPAPFIGHKAVWTGTEMIVWGQYSTGYPASGGRYNPATDSWTATSDVDAPVTRYAHRAVWTGTEMIVWGGHLNGVAYPAGYLNDGGRYNPTTNSWRPTSADGAPGPRESHTAVWTGSEMIVWGGDTGLGTTSTGGRYDPASDTWVSTSEVDVPGTRALHSAVWNGTEMIVWGGDSSSDGHGYLAVNTGGRYIPSTDTWTPTSLANAPGRRSRHTAIWTGSRMIVWGGGPLYTNTGGVYDPFQDTWTPTSMSGALPDGREDHSSVWTGREMIISGGHQGGQPFNGHGGRYDPALSTWVPMSPLGEPLARPTSTAVWTGSEMLVWGGFAGTSNGYSGRYCALACEVTRTLYKDFDGDGYGNPAESIESCPQLPGYVENADDCNDQDARIHPGVTEICNGLDDDCDGIVDDGLDSDGDGVSDCVDNCPTIPNFDQNPCACAQCPAVEGLTVDFSNPIGKGSGVVSWSTTQEFDVVGFNIVTIDGEGTRTQLNPALIRCEECVTGAGHFYSYVIPKHKNGHDIFLEVLFLQGTVRLAGPAVKTH